MVRPLGISREELKHWADKYDAPAKLPVLVRRLLLATTPISAITMRGDGGTRLGGWDGEVMARRETPFCPMGLSVWELSVEGNTKTKLDRDFDKRTAKPNLPAGVDSKRVTYVAVTARSFDKKKVWAKEKKALGRWADVRVYDVDDLAMWLEQAPAVATWFGASELGRPTQDPTDAETWLQTWTQRTKPALPWNLVLLGHERQKVAHDFREWLRAEGGGIRFLQGETSEEVLHFACAVLASDSDLASPLSRAIIVHDLEALRWAVTAQRLEPAVVIPSFEVKELDEFSAKAKANRTKILVPVDGTSELPGIELPSIPRRLLDEALVHAGLAKPEASRLAEQSNGSLQHLQALCGYSPLSNEWRDMPRAELFALLMAGEWTPTQEADRIAMRNLGGNPDDVDTLCLDLQKRGKIERVDEGWGPASWKWQSPKTTWQQLGNSLTDSDLHRFSTTAFEVLSTLHPIYDLPKGERVYAVVKGAVLPHSVALRQGLATSLVMLAMTETTGNAIHRTSTRKQKAAELLYRLLNPERGWKAWASLAPLLPLLAEAAPEDFVRLLEKSIDKKNDGACRLIDEEGTPSSGDPTPHVDLLWALEILAWSPEATTVERVAIACARLAAHDKDGSKLGKVMNRPAGTLSKMLNTLSPQSRSTATDRLRIVRRLLRDQDETIQKLGWSVCREMIAVLGRGFHFSGLRRPRYQWEAIDVMREAPRQEQTQQSSGALDLMLEHVGTSVSRWVELLDLILVMGDHAQKVIDALGPMRGVLRDPADEIRHALRERMQRWDWRPEQFRDAALLEKLRELYRLFTPSDLVEKHAWLFTFKGEQLSYTEGSGWNLEEGEKSIQELRVGAIDELLAASDGWEKIAQLSQMVNIPIVIGEALATSIRAADVEKHFLEESPSFQEGILGQFFAVRYEALPNAQAETWIRDVLANLLQNGRLDDAAEIALSLKSKDDTWDLVDHFGDPLASRYWQRTQGPYGDFPAQTFERAITRQLLAGNVLEAFDTLSRAKDKVSTKLTLEVLERVKSALPENASDGPENMFGYRLEKILDRLDKADDVDAAVVFELERAFMPYISDPKRTRRFFSMLLGEDPTFFVQCMNVMFRREGEPPPVDPIERAENSESAEKAYVLISSWEGYPGEDLAAAQREDKLETWATTVLDACAANGRGAVGAIKVGEVLARVPNGADGHWPCIAARKLLRRNKYPELAEGLRIAQHNRRGVTTRAVDEGGDQERDLALTYLNMAARLHDEFPEAADMLRELARDYQAEAEQWDARAKRVESDYGIQSRKEDPTPPSPVTLIQVQNAAPAPEFAIDLAPRLNVLTGDNSLGKTFVLDVLWWTLTGSWAGQPAKPEPKQTKNGKIAKSKATIRAKTVHREITGTYNALHERWNLSTDKPIAPGLVIYARVDGSFSVWDPIRNVAPVAKDEVDLSKGYHFTPREVWDGKKSDDQNTTLCRGLVDDIALWRKDPDSKTAMDLLENVLRQISPGPDEVLKIHDVARFKVRDEREVPRLEMPYGNVFIEHASAAVKRMLSLAYVLVWAVTAIRRAAPIAEMDPLRYVTFLVDEVEAHLHPKWQRNILRALLDLSKNIAPNAELQWVVTTHAPLILVSIEQLVDAERDALFDFDFDPENKIVVVEREPWEIYGDVNGWLSSEIFNEVDVRSKEAEEALEEISKLLTAPDVEKDKGRKAYEDLVKALGPNSSQLLRFRYLCEKKGWLP